MSLGPNFDAFLCVFFCKICEIYSNPYIMYAVEKTKLQYDIIKGFILCMDIIMRKNSSGRFQDLVT